MLQLAVFFSEELKNDDLFIKKQAFLNDECNIFSSEADADHFVQLVNFNLKNKVQKSVEDEELLQKIEKYQDKKSTEIFDYFGLAGSIEYDDNESKSFLNEFYKKYDGTDDLFAHLKFEDLKKLRSEEPLNYEIIYAFFTFLCSEEITAFNNDKTKAKVLFFSQDVFSYMHDNKTLEDGVKLFDEVNLDEFQHIIFPFYEKPNRYAIIIVDQLLNKMVFYDTLFDADYLLGNLAMTFLSSQLNFVQNKRNSTSKIYSLTVYNETPKQEKTVDYGVYICMFAFYFHQNRKLDLKFEYEKHGKYFRLFILFTFMHETIDRDECNNSLRLLIKENQDDADLNKLKNLLLASGDTSDEQSNDVIKNNKNTTEKYNDTKSYNNKLKKNNKKKISDVESESEFELFGSGSESINNKTNINLDDESESEMLAIKNDDKTAKRRSSRLIKNNNNSNNNNNNSSNNNNLTTIFPKSSSTLPSQDKYVDYDFYDYFCIKNSCFDKVQFVSLLNEFTSHYRKGSDTEVVYHYMTFSSIMRLQKKAWLTGSVICAFFNYLNEQAQINHQEKKIIFILKKFPTILIFQVKVIQMLLNLLKTLTFFSMNKFFSVYTRLLTILY
jgi:hypothetical protein